MFEMKNESDTSVNKRKNEEHFAKLDKDRKNKNCEYAILVSTLEQDNELYNAGIVDVSQHIDSKYDKMLVVRPDFFISIITLLLSMSKDKNVLRKKIHEYEHQQIDVSTFESDLNDFKGGIFKCFDFASSNSDKIIKDIDRVIKVLQDIKDNAARMKAHLSTAKNRADKVTIQKCSSKYPSLFSSVLEASSSNTQKDNSDHLHFLEASNTSTASGEGMEEI